MYKTEELLQMLTSRKWYMRYDACEWLRLSQESSPEIVCALERATHDEDKVVAKRAKYALQADVHRQIANELGIIRPDDTEANRTIYPFPLSKSENRKLSKRETLKYCLFGISGALFIYMGFVSIVNTLSDQRLLKNSKSWPVTKGEVISTDIETYNNEYGDISYPVITYQYTVSGIDYCCKIRSPQWYIYKKLPVESHVTVYYDPDRPKVCVSEYDKVGFPWGSLIIITIGSILVLVSILTQTSPRTRKFLR